MPNQPIQIPCGRCLKCQIVTASGWAIRGMLELQMHENAMFLTLSYAPKHLPKGNTLVREHIQLFIKRLRQHAKRMDSGPIRFIYCGEYGTKKGRAHYHAIIYGFKFTDLEFHQYSKGNVNFPLYTSPELSKLWPYGLHEIGEVTFESVRYLAKYTTKKEYGKKAKIAYKDKLAPFVQGSTVPAIGIPWLKRFKTDVYPCDHVLIDGVKRKPPKSFDNWLEKTDPVMFQKIKRKRVQKANADRIKHPEEYTPQRQLAKQEYLRIVTANQDRHI